MLENIELIAQSAIRIKNQENKIIYFPVIRFFYPNRPIFPQ